MQDQNKWEKQGFGKAPFICVGMFQMPNKETATMQDYQALPRMSRGGCGSCYVCGTGIVYNYIVKDADGETFVVGCDCVNHTHDTVLIKQVRDARKQHRDEKRIRERKAEREARQAQWDIERAAFREELMKLYGDLFEKAAKLKLEYVDSIISSCKHYGNISEKQLNAITNAVERAEREAARKNEFFGEVKQRVTVELKVDRWIHIRCATWDRAELWLVIMRDSEGRTFTYMGNSDSIPDEGETAKIKFTIKEHTVYNGVNQTVIQRPAKV